VWNLHGDGKVAAQLDDFECYIDKKQSDRTYPGNPVLDTLYQKFQEEIEKSQFASLGSVISNVTRMMETREIPLISTEYLMVDEVQDMDASQFRFVMVHALNDIPTMIVGDDDQSLYSFRHALGEKIFKQFVGGLRGMGKECRIVTLSQNFRSKAEIVESCSRLIQHNHNRLEKAMKPFQSYGGQIKTYRLQRGQTYDWILDKVRQSATVESLAIITRKNLELDDVEQLLIEHGIPHNRSGSKSYFDTSACKQFLAVLHAVSSTDERRIVSSLSPFVGRELSTALVHALQTRTKPSGPALKGKQKIAARFDEALRLLRTDVVDVGVKSFTDLAKKYFTDKGYPEYEVKKIESLCRSICQFRGTLAERLKVFSLEKQSDEERITLLTAHGAKGREFDTVLIVNSDLKTWPLRSRKETRDMAEVLEEERRLFFVAATRAMNHLMVSFEEQKGESQFISECGWHIEDYIGE
jgi:DNA helicase II / ATP-dependent DNA helicase PcrA